MAPLYGLRHIRLRYGERTVLEIEDLTLENGRLFTLTGANGAGKSTLLQILAFLLPPSCGEILFQGAPVDWGWTALHRLRQKVTLVHQVPYLFKTTVFANLAFGLRIRGVRGARLHREVSRALDLVGLGGFEDRRATELSGGETQRVAMARALALKPAVLLLDEPLANVDAQTAAVLEALIQSLPQQGTTVILSTHNPQHSRRLGSTALHLEAGKLQGASL
ncbi:energy-coupling factor ABC transporter ATP-binding protein [Geoalkalibacter halelectricus]|uniref:energy-coupling factor ABC transporter ATP-binding protein n=1 Tax=Geoalkalibacter halelectricus TaxID=2847045 RepID=UPI003D1F9343